MLDFALARHNMVESQIRTNRVTSSPLIAAFEAVPRERFAPEGQRAIAYVDEDLPIGGGRFLMEPMVYARLLQAAELRPVDSVLEIGCATGYGVAVLSPQVASVVGLDSAPELVDRGNQILADLQVENAALLTGEMEAGDARQGPFDVIILAGAVELVPPALLEQLAPSGRLLAVVRAHGQPFGAATMFEVTPGGVDQHVIFDASVPHLPGFRRPAEFVL